jgi:sugar/nucleoside kinase (ribokinase family)
MNILTIGGVTQDAFLLCENTDFMTTTKNNIMSNYMLFEAGEKKEIAAINYEAGGGATNAAVSFARLGFSTACFCSVGNDYAGKTILTKLMQEGINTSFIHTDKSTVTGQSFIINSKHGESTIFAYRGANCNLPAEKIPTDYLASCKHLYITSLSHQSSSILTKITSLAKKHNVPVAVNPGISQLTNGTISLKESLKNIDIFILNSTEAQTFMFALMKNDEERRTLLTQDTHDVPCGINQPSSQAYLLHNPLAYAEHLFSVKQFFKDILKMGPRIVVVTNGCNGVYIASHNTVTFCPSMDITVTNTVGAGDAFGSCFVASLLLGNSIDDALQNGIINSASVLKSSNAKNGLLTKAQLEQQQTMVNKALIQHYAL